MTDYRMPGDIDIKLRGVLSHIPGYESKLRPAWDRFADKHNIDRDYAIARGEDVVTLTGEFAGAPALLTEVMKAGLSTTIKLVLIEKPDGEIEFEEQAE